MMRRVRLALFVCSALMPATVSAHALDPAYLDLASLGENRWSVTWRAPDLGGRPMELQPLLPAACSGEAPPSTFDGRAWVTWWVVDCPGGLVGGVIGIGGLERTSTDALIRYELEPGTTQMRRLTASETSFTVPADVDALGVLTSYSALGVTHILNGVDHLLFVFALLLLIPDRRRLFWAITAFTLAHSITLAAASLGWINVPPPPVEAVIALSIVFLAYELTLPRERRDPITLRYPWIVSFTFGLVHGLGFAGALREIGLPEGDIPLALFSFNIGVELGQILFVAIVLAIGVGARMLFPAVRERAALLTRVSSYAIGSVAAFWVIARMAAF